MQSKEPEHRKRLRATAECRTAADQTRAFRKELEFYLKNFKEFRNCFNEALSTTELAYQVGDAAGVIKCGDDIIRKLGGTINFNN